MIYVFIQAKGYTVRQYVYKLNTVQSLNNIGFTNQAKYVLLSATDGQTGGGSQAVTRHAFIIGDAGKNEKENYLCCISTGKHS